MALVKARLNGIVSAVMNDRLEEVLMDYLDTALEPFSLPDLVAFLENQTTALVYENLFEFLSYHHLAYLNPSWEGKDPLWVSRAGLFTGKSAIIRPGNREIAAGVFLPGSRLVPFQDPSYLPNELVFMYEGRELPRVSYQTGSDEVYPLYAFYGEEYVSQYLSLDNPVNANLFVDAEDGDPSSFSLMAVDVRDLYWRSAFRPGDLLAATVVDWAGGVFDLSIVPAPDLAQRSVWLSALEESLIQGFNSAGPSASMDEQLSFSFFLGQELIFSSGALPVSDLLSWSTRVDMEPYGVETRLWHKGTIIPAQISWNMTLINSPTSVVEEAFVLLGLPVNNIVLDSYIKDSLYLKEPNLDEVIKRFIPYKSSHAHFCVPIIEKAFELRKFELAQTYNLFADHEIGMLRNRFICLHSALSRTVMGLHQSGLSPDDIPEQGAVVLGQLMTHVVAAVESIDGEVSENSVDIESLWASIEGMEDSFFDTRTAIVDILPELQKKRFSIIRKKDTPNV